MSRSPQDIEALRQRVHAIQGWYHRIDFGDGVIAPGPFDMSRFLHHYSLPEDLRGQRVLDVGASNGYFTVEFVRRGAAEIVALDLPAWLDSDWFACHRRRLLAERTDQDRAFTDDHVLRLPFDVVMEELGHGRVRKAEMRIYDISSDRLGQFDLVFCGSMLMHVRDPALGLQRMREVVKDDGLFIGSISTVNSEEPIARFCGEPGACNYWRMSPSCFRQMLHCAELEPMGEGRTVDFRGFEDRFTDPHFICHAKPVRR